jgi:hypothetical protein
LPNNSAYVSLDRYAVALNATKNSEEKRGRWLVEPTLFVICAVIVGTLILGLVFDVLHAMYRESLLSVLNRTTGLVTFFANVAVLFYAFPAFTRTKDRCLLSIALAALMFAYVALFGLLLSVTSLTPASHISHLEATWYSATRYSTAIIALILYAYGVIGLIRRGHPNDLTNR